MQHAARIGRPLSKLRRGRDEASVSRKAEDPRVLEATESMIARLANPVSSQTSSMSEIETTLIHHGIWTDLSRGSTMGNTITTDARTGTLLIAITAVLCSLATSHLWHLITFGLYQYRADGKPKDALLRQQQAILRTFPAPSTVLAEFTKLYFSWRPSKNHSPAARMLPILVFTALFTVATVVAGIFSSYIVDTTNILVLVQSPSCGGVDFTMADVGQALTNNYSLLVHSLAAPMVQDCYDSPAPTSPSCRVYSKPRILFDVKRDDCPWNSSTCLVSDQPAVTMDSGMLDMNEAFGLNLPTKDQVHFRKKTSCAVLSLENRTIIVPSDEYASLPVHFPGEQILFASFGTYPGNRTWSNATLGVSLVATNVTKTRFPISVAAAYKDPYWSEQYSPLDLIAEVDRQDADIIFKIVGKGIVAYYHPTDDPIFSAHKERKFTDVGSGNNHTFYYSDFPISVVGCTEQYQFCLEKDNCTKLSYLPQNLTDAEFPNASSLQLAVLKLLIDSSFLFDIQNAVTTRADQLIRVGGYITSIPNDQWVTEIVGWESNTWASLQIAIEKYATGAKSMDPYADSYIRPPQTDGEKALCAMQRVRKSGGLVNINVFALCFTIAFSILFIALDLGILRFLVYLAGFRRTRWLAPRIERWIQDGVLQLQRRAFETSGQGTWKDLDKEIPTTTSREFLEDFPSVSPGVSFFEKSEELVAKDEKITPLRESRVHDIDVVDLADCDGADAVCKSPRDAKETADGQDHQRRSSQCVEQTLE